MAMAGEWSNVPVSLSQTSGKPRKVVQRRDGSIVIEEDVPGWQVRLQNTMGHSILRMRRTAALLIIPDIEAR